MDIKEKTKDDGFDVTNGYDVKSLPVYMWCNLAARGLICQKRPHGERDVKGLYMTQCVRAFGASICGGHPNSMIRG